MRYQTPLVSVIIPAYNCARFIGEALESVYKQTYKNWEIVIIDDGSKDKTNDALSPHMDKIKYFYQNNKGTAAARNAGVERARGELIAFLDNDDYWLPKKLEIQVRAIQNFPDVCLAFTDGKSFDRSGPLSDSLMPIHFRDWIKCHKKGDSIFIKGWIFKELLLGNVISSATSVLIRKKCFTDIGGFDEEISISDDYDLYLRLARFYPICIIKKCLYMWRYREDSQSGHWDIRMQRWKRASIQVLEKNKDIVPPALRYEYRRSLTGLYWKCGWFYFWKNQFKESRQMLIRCLRYNAGHVKAFFYLLATYLPLGLVNKIRSLKHNMRRKHHLE
jgi:glycosyltransferase involved in cell wall biosynthesis